MTPETGHSRRSRPSLRFQIEYYALRAVMAILMLLEPERASGFGGWAGRKIGPITGAHRLALKNLQTCLPGKTPAEYKKILSGMWDNLGRVMTEFPDLELLSDDVEMVGVEHLNAAMEQHKQAILFSGHIGNWEVMAPTLLRYNIPVDLVYRPPNNPLTARMLDKYRSLDGRLLLLPKSRAGTRQLVESVRTGRTVGILIDQKYNEGIEVPFFGRPAMTSHAIVQLGQKYNAPLIPFRVERVDKTQFRLSFFPPLPVVDNAGNPRDAFDVLKDAHTLLESWITSCPEQWLWIHKRWKKEA